LGGKLPPPHPPLDETLLSSCYIIMESENEVRDVKS
jgi:hypothetical protein